MYPKNLDFEDKNINIKFKVIFFRIPNSQIQILFLDIFDTAVFLL